MYKHWKEVSYEEFRILCAAGVVCASNDYGAIPSAEPEDLVHFWVSLYGWSRDDLNEPPDEGERFFVWTDCEE